MLKDYLADGFATIKFDKESLVAYLQGKRID